MLETKITEEQERLKEGFWARKEYCFMSLSLSTHSSSSSIKAIKEPELRLKAVLREDALPRFVGWR